MTKTETLAYRCFTLSALHNNIALSKNKCFLIHLYPSLSLSSVSQTYKYESPRSRIKPQNQCNTNKKLLERWKIIKQPNNKTDIRYIQYARCMSLYVVSIRCQMSYRSSGPYKTYKVTYDRTHWISYIRIMYFLLMDLFGWLIKLLSLRSLNPFAPDTEPNISQNTDYKVQ